jgi:subtilisin family serine protease
MTDTRQRLVAVFLAFVTLTSVLAGVPFAGAQSTDAGDAIARQNPASVAISERLQSTEGEVVVVARLDGPSIRPSASAATAQRRLKSRASQIQQDLVSFADRADGVRVFQRFWLGNFVLLEVDRSRTSLQQIASVRGVERLHPNYEFEVPETNSETGVSISTGVSADQVSSHAAYTYGLEQLNVPDVWQEFTRGTGAKVAVLDTGVQADHPAIDLYTRDASNASYPGGWAEFDEDGHRVSGSTPHDTGWHGTHTSGTVAGQNVSGVPAFGVAPNAKLMHGLVLPNGSGTFTQVVAGMQWAIEEDADVVSLSLGMKLDPNSQISLPIESALITPVRDARAAGTYVVVSSGNKGEGTIMSPGAIYDATSVGASNASGGIAEFSSGDTVSPTDVWTNVPSDWPSEYVYPDVSAPGVDVLSSVSDSDYGSASGTSMAAPHVAGVVALMHSAAENRPSPGEIDDVLAQTAGKPADAPSSKDTRYGSGIVDAHGAVSAVVNTSASDVTVSVEPASAETTVDGSRTFGVVVQGVDTGVGAYAFDLSLSNATVAAIEDVSLMGSPESSTVSISPDSSSVQVDASGTDTEDSGDVTVAMVTVGGEVAGSSALDLSVGSVEDETGNAYQVSDVSDGTLTVLEPAAFAVSGLTPTDYTAAYDEVVDVTATVENRGGVSAETVVELRIDDGDTVETVGSQSVDLGPGENTLVEFQVDAGDLAAGDYIHSVWTEDGEASGTLRVEAPPEPARFTISSVTPSDAEVILGESAEVSATIVNEGELVGEEPVELRVDGEVVDSRVVELEAGASTTVPLEIAPETTDALDPGPHTYTVVTSNDSAEGTLTVLEPATFVVSELRPGTYTAGSDEVVDVSATVTNTGDVAAAKRVELRVEDGDGVVTVANRTLGIDAGTSQSIEFDLDAEQFQDGNYTYSVWTEDDAATGTLIIDGGSALANFTLSGLEVSEDTVAAHERFDVTAVVENTGQGGGTQRVTLTIGETVAATELTLASGRSRTVVFENVSIASAGNYTVTLATLNDTVRGPLTIYRLGDVNRDGTIGSADVTLVLRYVVGLDVQKSFDEEVADVNGDGTINSGDATLIQRMIVGLESEATVGFPRVLDVRSPWTFALAGQSVSNRPLPEPVVGDWGTHTPEELRSHAGVTETPG